MSEDRSCFTKIFDKKKGCDLHQQWTAVSSFGDILLHEHGNSWIKIDSKNDRYVIRKSTGINDASRTICDNFGKLVFSEDVLVDENLRLWKVENSNGVFTVSRHDDLLSAEKLDINSVQKMTVIGTIYDSFSKLVEKVEQSK